MTSPSTLIRRAAKAKTPAAAKRLRTQAAKMRREIRSKDVAGRKITKELESASRNKAQPDALAGIKQIVGLGWKAPESAGSWRAIGAEETIGNQASVNRLSADAGVAQPDTLVSYDDVDRIRKLARAKKNTDSLAIALRGIVMNGKSKGRTEMHDLMAQIEKNAEERVQRNLKATSIKTICGFMAAIDLHQQSRGSIPPAIVVDGWTAGRIYDALREAGYDPETGVRVQK